VPLRLLLVVNTRARRGRDARNRAAAELRRRGHAVTIGETRRAADLTPLIAQHRGAIDAVAVGGGDGTLIAAIEGLRALGVPLLILPLGTINEVARTLRIPLDVTAACALVDDGIVRPVDAGRVNGTWYFSEASIGFSTHVARLQTGEVKSRWGMLAIPIATVQALRALRPYQLDVENAGGRVSRLRTMQLTVANSNRFGGVVERTDAAIDDGMLDLYSIELRHWLDAARIVAAVALRRFPHVSGVVTERSSRFVVRSRTRRGHHVFADGEPAGRTPAEFTVVPAAVSIYVPR
jgi:YegS/Rv2252/BmrU family lipid kinase